MYISHSQISSPHLSFCPNASTAEACGWFLYSSGQLPTWTQPCCQTTVGQVCCELNAPRWFIGPHVTNCSLHTLRLPCPCQCLLIGLWVHFRMWDLQEAKQTGKVKGECMPLHAGQLHARQCNLSDCSAGRCSTQLQITALTDMLSKLNTSTSTLHGCHCIGSSPSADVVSKVHCMH